MNKRKKIYYPEYQIDKDKFTRGGEFMDSGGVEYIGPYHTYTTGEVFSESEYNQMKSKKLYPLRRDIQNTYKMQQIKKNSYTEFLKSDLDMVKYTQPNYSLTKPIKSDFDRGFYNRYFAVKRNDDTVIFEISQAGFEQYGKLGGINKFLYIVDTIRWTLTGPEQDIKSESGSILKYGVTSNNTRMVELLSKTYRNIKIIFPNPDQFTIYDRSFTPN